jgi:hypothetical protein
MSFTKSHKKTQVEPGHLIDTALHEFEQVQLGDKRRVKRLVSIVRALVDDPSQSFPEAVKGNEADLKGLYRFFSSEHVAMEAELKPHLRACWNRASLLDCCFAVHDSSELVYNTLDDDITRKGLEKASRHTQRLRIHPTLMVAADGSRVPLGLAAMMTWARTPEDRERRPAGWGEQQRWLDQALYVEEKVGHRVDIIHLMDRDADSYDLLDGILKANTRFVIRMEHDRRISHPVYHCISEALNGIEPVGHRTITISKRGTRRSVRQQKKHPPREKRTANVSVRSTTVSVPRPHSGGQHTAARLECKVVEVLEPNPPEGEAAVRWYLLTTESVVTEEHCWAVVDAYCHRWIIEEFFKSVKTGCAVEDRQLKSRESIEAMLGVMLPLAWRLLLMRHLPRVIPDEPATVLFLPTELEVLDALMPDKLNESSTIKEACAVLAALGGHLKRSGEAGWLVLWRGHRTLQQHHQGYLVGIKRRSG